MYKWKDFSFNSLYYVLIFWYNLIHLLNIHQKSFYKAQNMLPCRSPPDPGHAALQAFPPAGHAALPHRLALSHEAGGVFCSLRISKVWDIRFPAHNRSPGM